MHESILYLFLTFLGLTRSYKVVFLHPQTSRYLPHLSFGGLIDLT